MVRLILLKMDAWYLTQYPVAGMLSWRTVLVLEG